MYGVEESCTNNIFRNLLNYTKALPLFMKIRFTRRDPGGGDDRISGTDSDDIIIGLSGSDTISGGGFRGTRVRQVIR